MNYIAYQIDPEHQESPLFYDDDLPVDVSIFGNRDYRKHFSSEIEPIMQSLLDSVLIYELEEAEGIEAERDVLHDYFGSNILKLDDDKIRLLSNLILEDDDKFYASIFTLLTGRKYSRRMITGSFQSEWNYLYFPNDTYKWNQIDWVEIEYFNTGSEWNVYSGELADDYEFTIYCHSNFYNDIRFEIAQNLFVPPSQVNLKAFDGYTRSPKYKEIVFD